MVLSEPILMELEEKLVDKFEHTPEEAAQATSRLREAAILVEATGRSGWVAADQDDDKFIETALAGNAERIVSGDRHLLQLKSIEGISVTKPRAFRDELLAAGD